MQQLLTDTDRAILPDLYATEGQGDEALCLVHLFAPGTYWHWYLVELDRRDGNTAYGLTVGHDIEAGYVWLPELTESGRVVRDDAWTMQTMGETRKAAEAERQAG